LVGIDEGFGAENVTDGHDLFGKDFRSAPIRFRRSSEPAVIDQATDTLQHSMVDEVVCASVQDSNG
jgi:hypothetical protein